MDIRLTEKSAPLLNIKFQTKTKSLSKQFFYFSRPNRCHLNEIFFFYKTKQKSDKTKFFTFTILNKILIFSLKQNLLCFFSLLNCLAKKRRSACKLLLFFSFCSICSFKKLQKKEVFFFFFNLTKSLSLYLKFSSSSSKI